jgi:hypothetical protein
MKVHNVPFSESRSLGDLRMVLLMQLCPGREGVSGSGALPAVARVAQALSYPARPVRIIVPFPAGGAIWPGNTAAVSSR